MTHRPFAYASIAAATFVLVACSPSTVESTQDAQASTVRSVPEVLDPATTQTDPASELRRAAEQLDRSATARDLETAWSFYSQRCKNEIGSIEAYGAVLDSFYRGRTPNYTDWTVRVNGSSGQVVTIDSDPSAPASAMNPRTWTFIDGRWQFDNC